MNSCIQIQFFWKKKGAVFQNRNRMSQLVNHWANLGTRRLARENNNNNNNNDDDDDDDDKKK